MFIKHLLLQAPLRMLSHQGGVTVMSDSSASSPSPICRTWKWMPVDMCAICAIWSPSPNAWKRGESIRSARIAAITACMSIPKTTGPRFMSSTCLEVRRIAN